MIPESMPRVLHVSSLYPPEVTGGAEKVVEMLAEAQAASGQRVGVAYLSRAQHTDAARRGVDLLPQRSRNLLWIDDVFRQPRIKRTANKLWQMVNYRAAADFGRAIRAFRPDVVHTHSMVELPPMVWREIAASGARTVHTLHDYDLVCSRASRFRNGHNCEELHASCRALAAWKGHFAQAIDAVAAVSAPVLDEHRRFGLFRDLAPDHAQVIWNAVNTAAAATPDAAARDDGDFTFGFMGRLVSEKGIETLLAACRLLPASGWRLKVAGHAQEGDARYRALAVGLPVDFLGFTDPAPFLRSLDVLVVPSVWREPFGLTVVEAFAQGVPVIGSRLGAIADLVGTVGDDWLVPAADPRALATRMRQAIADGRAVRPDRAAFAPVLDAVSLPRMVERYAALYATVLAARHAA